jgi:hypothetical protein
MSIEYLYKYRSLSGDSSHVEQILLHDELYFPRPKEFNDPFDCCPVLSFPTGKELAGYLNRLHKKQIPHKSRADRRRRVSAMQRNLSEEALTTMGNEAIAEVVNSVGVLSLSAKHDHILMWSHYANSHHGICLRFQASASTPFFGRAQRVLYQVDRPILNPIHDNLHTQSEKALLTKADFWCYEQEWRVIEHDTGPGVHKFPPKLLDAVILGARISPADKQKVLYWLAQRSTKTEVLQAQIDTEKFRLKILKTS